MVTKKSILELFVYLAACITLEIRTIWFYDLLHQVHPFLCTPPHMPELCIGNVHRCPDADTAGSLMYRPRGIQEMIGLDLDINPRL